MTEQLIMDAAKIALAPDGLFLEDVKQAKTNGTLPDYYTEIVVTPVYEDSTDRVGPFNGGHTYRLSTRYVSKTRDGGTQMRRVAKAALEFTPLTVAGGAVTTPCRFETGTGIAEDDGQYSGVDDWTVRL